MKKGERGMESGEWRMKSEAKVKRIREKLYAMKMCTGTKKILLLRPWNLSIKHYVQGAVQ